MVWPPSTAGQATDGLEAADVVLVHDGTPPSAEHLDRLLDRLGETEVAAVATIEPVTDAVKRLDADDLVAGTVDRARLARIGLPQVVKAAQWAGAAGSAAADDDTPAAALVRSGAVVVGVVRHPS